VGSVSSVLSTVAGSKLWNLDGASLAYSNSGATYSGENAMIIHMFDTELNNFNNFVNDFKFQKNIADKADITLGLYKSYQNINMSWLWNSYLSEVKGENAIPLDIIDSTGTNLSQDGLYAYGVPLWGNCCQRNYNTKYDIAAPYLGVAVELNENINFDGSVRYDIGKVTGNYASSQPTKYDVNNDNSISAIEDSVSAINFANPKPVNYDYDYVSYSLGLNAKISENSAIFGRYSSGASAKADRVLFTGNARANGKVVGVLDLINQGELGYKQKFDKGGLFITAFYAGVSEEGGFEATTNSIIQNDYQSYGLELEGAFNFTENFDLRGSATMTQAEITTGENKGNAPRRQAGLIGTLMPTYTLGKSAIGLSIIGTTSSFAQDNNELILPGYAIVNAFVNVGITNGLVASLNVNNLTNTLGITESEEGSIIENTNNILRVRSIFGRTISATIRYNF
jgi:outer membrane receptor protein involved in Fe transport